MSVESAYPDRLLSYASVAKAGTNALRGPASRLSAAIEAFLATHPDPQVISGVTDWGQEMLSYASRKAQIDQWVHDVGLAFQSADHGHPSRPVTLPSAPTTITQVLRQQQLQSDQKRLQEEQDCTVPGQVGPLGLKQVPPDPNAPRAEALPPGALAAAAQHQQALRNLLEFLGASGLPDDPHAEGGSGTGNETGWGSLGSTDLPGEPTVGDAADGL